MNQMSVGNFDLQRVKPSLTRDVLKSFAHCQKVARRQARNFYYGLKLTPEPKRSAVYVIYAFMRACDDLADAEPGEPIDAHERAKRINSFRSTMVQVIEGDPQGPLPEGPIWPAFRYVVHAYRIDAVHLHAMLDGQQQDLVRKRYRTFDDLYDYCYKVASIVGLVCIGIWGNDGDPATAKLAEYRGIALQLTNILRDLAEDARRDRIYIPHEELERFGCREEDLLQQRPSGGFDRLMRFQIERAKSYYAMSASLEKHIDPASRATCWAMMRIYRGLLDRISEQPRIVLERRVRLSPVQKLRIAAQAHWQKPWSA